MTSIEPKTNQVVVDDLTSLSVDRFIVEEVNWLAEEYNDSEPHEIEVVPRYRAKPLRAGYGSTWQVTL